MVSARDDGVTVMPDGRIVLGMAQLTPLRRLPASRSNAPGHHAGAPRPPHPGRWLTRAERARSVRPRPCLSRRIADRTTMARGERLGRPAPHGATPLAGHDRRRPHPTAPPLPGMCHLPDH